MAKSKKKKSAASSVKAVILAAVMAGLLLLAYYHVAHTDNSAEAKDNEVETTAVQEVLLRNLDTDYPPSPKEVVKYYSELTKCLYNEECAEEELEQLARTALSLYDDELAQNQEWNRYFTNLKSEIATKKSQEYAIMSYRLSASTDVVFFKKDGYECASLYCTYNIRNGSIPGTVNELFILRKDESGHWKIFGWDIADE